jgi:hypothetical protein
VSASVASASSRVDTAAMARRAFEAAYTRARGGAYATPRSTRGKTFDDFFFERDGWRSTTGDSSSSSSSSSSSIPAGEGFYADASCSHCAALGLPARVFVTPEALKSALRTQAMKWHPDRHDDASKAHAEIRFKRVYDAYHALAKR